MSIVGEVTDPPRDNGKHSADDLRAVLALRSRAPGYAVAQKCLELQSAAEQQNPSLRTDLRTILAPEAKSWFVGAQGERAVGTLLAGLGPEWLVLHAVPIGAGTKDVDHLLVGPPGVFAINTKHHRDARVWVGDHVLRLNNSNTHHLRAARSDARDASRRLNAAAGYPVSVTSVLVIVGERSIVDARRGPRNDPVVVSSRGLLSWLTTLRPQLSDAERDHLRLITEEPITWHIDRSAANTLRVIQRFERLEAEVSRSGAVAPAASISSRSATVRRAAPPQRPPVRTRRRSRGSKRAGVPKLLLGFGLLLTMPVWLPAVGTVVSGVLTSALTSAVTP